MRKFWNWVQNSDDTRTLYLDGIVAEESWFGDEITPRQFKDELVSGTGDVTIWINSPGGDVFAASQIYNMLMEYKGRITVKIDGLAASAASVIAMAGGEVLMSPVSMLMVHNPATIAIGDSDEMLRAKALLDEVKEAIVNAYELKTRLSRAKISRLMDMESWMNANKAVQLGFADGILYTKDETAVDAASVESDFTWNKARFGGVSNGDGLLFSRQAVMNSILRKLPHTDTQVTQESQGKTSTTSEGTPAKTEEPPTNPDKPSANTGTPIESLDKRLSLISH